MSTPHAAHRNALAESTSPYLLQHADNPVQWYPWGEEALERARREDKPILLSIGYSACHWCHVMAHESFEDEATAALMNERFVNIKVDREERPDLDRIYQLSHYLLTQRNGGWPLTVFLNPHNRTPFFAGTYFPRESRYGMPGFRYVLERVADFYRQQREEVDKQNAALVRALSRVDFLPYDAEARITSEPLNAARQLLGKHYDSRHGGFGGAPKFPHPTSVERMLRHYAAATANSVPDEDALRMALDTLRHMAEGGIYDQIGGGFCRYSVDEQWMIPHFEKMLYDNGPLLGLYADAWQLTADPLFERVLQETAGWALREMQGPEGGFYSSLDADSEGQEGKYYVWDPAEARALLEEREYTLLAARFGLDGPPNFEGKWHLHVCRALDDVAARAGLELEEARALLDRAREKLLAARASRVRPGCDDKILVSWNALMIKGLARAALATGEVRYCKAAQLALDFVRRTLWRDGRLLATSKDGRAHLNAYLDDYAFLIDAVLHLAQCEWRTQDLEFAQELAEVLLTRFEDHEHGGFFFTSHDHEQLIHRSKPMSDESLPSGNGVAAVALGRLGHLLGETRYLDAAERILKAAWPAITQAPYAHTALLAAVEEHLLPPEIIVLRGEGEELSRWHRRCTQGYAPRRLVFAIPSETAGLPGLLAERSPRGTAVAYICEGMQCRAPLLNYDELPPGITAARAQGEGLP